MPTRIGLHERLAEVQKEMARLWEERIALDALINKLSEEEEHILGVLEGRWEA